MSYIPYRTATEWKAYYAAINNVGLSDDQKVQIDILGTLENTAAMTGTASLTFTTDGTGTYQNNALIGRTISAVFISVMLQSSEYTFDATTGTITWTDTPDTDINGLIQYA